MATKKQETALATPQAALMEAYPILSPAMREEAREIIDANLGGAGVDISTLDKITVPPGGGIAFTVPGLEGPESVSKLSGIILLAPAQNGYWARSIEDGPTDPPACFSNDGRTGYGDPFDTGESGTHVCAGCPKKAWGTDPKGKGKACRDLRPIYLLQEGDYVPVVIQTSRMSLKPFQQYLQRLAKAGIVYYSCVTEIGLTQESKPGTPTYSRLTFAMKSVLPKEARPILAEYRALLEQHASQPPTAEDAVQPQTNGDNYDPFAGD